MFAEISIGNQATPSSVKIQRKFTVHCNAVFRLFTPSFNWATSLNLQIITLVFKFKLLGTSSKDPSQAS